MRAAALRRLCTPLAACALALVAAGCGNNAELIPASDASKLDTALQRVADATDAGECDRATAALKEAQDTFAALPSEVSSRLTTRIAAGLNQLAGTVPTQCLAGGTTPADSGTTGPETTTSTTTTTTEPPPADSGPTGPTTTEPPPTDETPQEPDPGGIAPESGQGPDGNGPPGQVKKDGEGG